MQPFDTGDTIAVSDNSPVFEGSGLRNRSATDFTSEFRTVGTVRPLRTIGELHLRLQGGL